jgi:tetratricopeptide (TPR) repeat protein
LGEHDQAIELAQKGLSLNPESAYYIYWMASMYLRAEMYEEAIDLYRTAMAQNPEFSLGAHLAIGRIYRGMREFKKAFENYEKAVMIDPINVDGYLYLGYYYRIIGEYEKAAAQFKKMIELEPNRESNYRRYGRTLNILGEHELAIEQFEKSVDIDPSNIDFLAEAHYFTRNLDKAIEWFEKAAEADPDNLFPVRWLSSCYLETGQYEKSKECHERWLDMFEFPNRDKILKKAFPEGPVDEKMIRNCNKYIMEEVNRKANPGWGNLSRAFTWILAGEKDSTFVYLNRLYDNQSNPLIRLIAKSSFVDDLRSDPRFIELVKKLKLEEYAYGYDQR